MEPGEGLKRSFAAVEWWVLKAPPLCATSAEEKDREGAEEATKKICTVVRQRVYAVAEPEYGWLDSFQDHLRWPLWPASWSADLHAVAFLAALCLRAEVRGVAVAHRHLCRLRLARWQQYVVVLELSGGPSSAPGPGSFQFAALVELVTRGAPLWRQEGLFAAMAAAPEEWHVAIDLQHSPAARLPWSELRAGYTKKAGVSAELNRQPLDLESNVLPLN